jgi:hypothetical protein
MPAAISIYTMDSGAKTTGRKPEKPSSGPLGYGFI